jgi:mono/diheme cytochrome c family protein
MLLVTTACTGTELISAPEASAMQTGDEHDDSHENGDDHEQDEHDDVNDHDEGEHSGVMDHMHVDAPDEFTSLENPIAADHEAIEAGEETYNTLCVTCHGEQGKGDGPGSAELDPKPADLSDGMMLSSLSDGYLFWRVSKGGAMEPFNSAMPAWEEGLTEEQRWQVISYIRTLSAEHDTIQEMDDEHMDDDHDHDD